MNFEIPDINKIRKELDEKNAEMEKKERERIEKEYERSSEQEKLTQEKPKEKIEEKVKTEKEKPSAAKAMEGKEKEDLEKEITGNFYDELEKIKDMPDKAEGFNKTTKFKMKKTEKYFQLIENWQDSAYLDDYKGIKNIFSELDKLKPSIFLYNLKKAQITNDVAKSMALNYKEWNLEDKEKLKIIKNFVNKQSKEKNIFYSKDKTLKEIVQILALKNIPYKNNIDVIVREIENPDIKSETIAGMANIEKESIEKKKQSLQALKEDMKRDKLPPDKIIMEQLEKLGVDPKAASEILSKLVETLENPKVQKEFEELKNTKEFQKLRNTIEKATKKKEEIPESVAKAAEFVKREKKEGEKESPWKTAFGATGWVIVFFLVLFILLLSKGVDYLAKTKIDITGGKKKEKK